MKEVIIKTEDLTKKYGSQEVLKNCNLNIKRGQIYALIGKNGAGKTTLMRILCGQSFKTSGSISIFGNTSEKSLIKNRARIGCMIEDPCFYPKMSAYKNLNLYAMRKGIPNKEQILEVLEFVGLLEVKNKKFEKLSLGMKRRLGFALALLGNPEILILDEPTNGLDLMGVKDVRNLILKLNKEKDVTILISSHILKELSMIATYYGFMDKGKIIVEMSNNELQERCNELLTISVSNVKRAVTVLEEFCGVERYRIVSENTIECFDNIEHPEQINKELSENDIEVYSISKSGKDLEDFFINLIDGGTQNA